MARRSSRIHAFTLIEVVVVLVILGVVTAVIGPNVASRLKGLARTDPAEALRSVLAGARRKAVRTGQTVCVELRTGDGAYRVVALDADRRHVEATGRVSGWHGAGRVVRSVCFVPTGIAQHARFRQPDEERQVYVEVDSWSGRVSIIE